MHAYLSDSAASIETAWIGCSIAANVCVTSSSVRSSRTPATVNGGAKKSSTPLPSRRNSGTIPTPKSSSGSPTRHSFEDRTQAAVDGPGRDGAAVDDREERRAIRDDGAELLGHPLDEAEVDRAVASRGRPDGDEDDVRVARGGREIGRHAESVRLPARSDQLVEPGLDDRADASLERLELVRIDVDADDGVPQLREARRRDCTDVSQTDNDDVHLRSCPPQVAKAAPTLFGRGKYLTLRLTIRRQTNSGAGTLDSALDPAVAASASIVAMTLWRGVCSMTPLRAPSSRLRSARVGSRSAVAAVAGRRVLGGTRSTSLFMRMFFAATARSCRRCRVDVRLGRVVRRSGLPFGDLLPLARDLVESGDARVDAGRGAGVEVGASRPGPGGFSSSLADTGRFAGLIDVYTTLATSDAVVAMLERRGLLTAEDLQNGALPITAAAVPSTVDAATPMMTITGTCLDRPEGDELTLAATSAFSTSSPRQLAAKIPVKDRIQLRVVKSAEAPKLVNPRSKALPILVLLGGLIATLAVAFTRDNVARARNGLPS